MARICNDERASFGVMSGHDRKTLSLSEHAAGVAAGARLLPMRQLAARLAEIPTHPRMPVLLICRTQNRSSATLKSLRASGYGRVRYVDGGMSEWARRGWPMFKPGP